MRWNITVRVLDGIVAAGGHANTARFSSLGTKLKLNGKQMWLFDVGERSGTDTETEFGEKSKRIDECQCGGARRGREKREV